MGRKQHKFGYLSLKTRESKKKQLEAVRLKKLGLKFLKNEAQKSTENLQSSTVNLLPGPSSSDTSTNNVGVQDRENQEWMSEVQVKEEVCYQDMQDDEYDEEGGGGGEFTFDSTRSQQDFVGGTSFFSSPVSVKKNTICMSDMVHRMSKAVSKSKTLSTGRNAQKEGPRTCHCLLCFKTFQPTRTSAPNGFDADFMVMFVLKKLLEIPNEKLQEYLQLGHPRTWIFLCDQCKPQILQAFDMQRSIEALETRLRDIQKNLKRTIKTSFNTRVDMSAASNNKLSIPIVTSHVRKFVANGNCDYGIPKPASVRRSNKIYQTNNVVVTGYRPSLDPLSTDLQPDSPKISDFGSGVEGPKSFYDENSDCSDDNSSSRLPISFITVKIADSTKCNKDEKRLRKETTMRCCTLCPKIRPMDSNAFALHVLYHYNRPYKCLECGSFLTGNQLELNNHPKDVRINTEIDPNHSCVLQSVAKVTYEVGKIWECAYCRQAYDKYEDRDIHEHTTHPDLSSVKLTVKCSTCSKLFRSLAEWRVHRALEHPSLAKFGCFHCDESFKITSKEGIEFLDVKKMREHLLNHDRNLDKKIAFECDFCGANFPTINDLKDHVGVEHTHDNSRTVKLFSCPICFIRWTSERSLQHHLQSVHCSITHKKCQSICDICGYSAWKIYKLHEHKFMKHGITPDTGRPILKCSNEDCTYECLLKATLNYHMMKAHGKERRYKCEVCGKGFMNSSNLRCHQEIHKNAVLKPFQCEICGNSFAVKNYLYIHMRLSHQNRPFASTHKKKPARSRNKVKQIAIADRSPLDLQTQMESSGTDSYAGGNEVIAPGTCQSSSSNVPKMSFLG